MIIYTPIYNEMPWTPFFLRHLLDFDCPIMIGEGASETLQKESVRSWDGSWEIIQTFAEKWPDRVTVYKHNYRLNTSEDRKALLRPRERVKMNVWNNASDGEWIVGLSPDNFYMPEDIKKLKQSMSNASGKIYNFLTGMRVFAFNFENFVKRPEKYICGCWFNVWPCIWRKNNEYVLTEGNELLLNSSGHWLAGPEVQTACSSNPNVIQVNEIKQFHYKNVKPFYNRLQRYGKNSSVVMNYPLKNSELFDEYNGPHHPILDDHPYRHIADCRTMQFNWEDFRYLVTEI